MQHFRVALLKCTVLTLRGTYSGLRGLPWAVIISITKYCPRQLSLELHTWPLQTHFINEVFLTNQRKHLPAWALIGSKSGDITTRDTHEQIMVWARKCFLWLTKNDPVHDVRLYNSQAWSSRTCCSWATHSLCLSLISYFHPYTLCTF